MQKAKHLEYVVYQTRDGIEPFAIAAFLERYEAENYLKAIATTPSKYSFFIRDES